MVRGASWGFVRRLSRGMQRLSGIRSKTLWQCTARAGPGITANGTGVPKSQSLPRANARCRGMEIASRHTMTTRRFKVGDHVTWNSEAGHVTGTIIRVHTRAVDYKGHTHRATADEPQYEIRSSKTDHIAMHRGAVLKRTRS
jgi:hypothetical protein